MLQRSLHDLRGNVGSSITADWFYVYAVDFSALAKGASKTNTIKIDAGADFVVQGIHFAANFANGSAPTTATEESKLYRSPDNFAAELTSAHLGMLALQFATSDRPWSNIPIRCDLLTGEPGDLFLLPTEIYIAGTDTVRVQLDNNLPASVGGATNPAIDAQVALVGRKMQRAAA